MIAMLLAIAVLHAGLTEPADLRLVAAGTGPAPVDWSVDGAWVATTMDHEGAQIHVLAGVHRIAADSHSSHPWTAMVRLAPVADGLAYVPAWTALVPGEAVQPIPSGWLGVPASLAAALLVARSKEP